MLPKPRKTTDTKWRPNWEDLPETQRQQLEAWCKEIKALIEADGIEIVDYQLVGSRAYGNNSPDSDYDVVFVPKEDKYHRTHPRPAQLRAREISQANGLGFFIGIGPCAKHLVCHSFKDGKFHGKNHGDKVNKKARFFTKLGVFKHI